MSESNGFHITDGVFEKYDGPVVEVLEIPDGVTTIKRYSLSASNLEGCKKIIFPASVKVLEDKACCYEFDWRGSRQDYRKNFCTTLEELEFLGKIDSVGAWAFGGGSWEYTKAVKVRKVTFHQAVGNIKEAAFRENDQLEEFHAPLVKKIGATVFLGCKKLKVLDISPKATIGERAFDYCNALKQDGILVVNGVLVSINKGKTIPEGVHTIDENALSGNYDNLTIPMSVRNIRSMSGDRIFLPEGFLLTDEKLTGKGMMRALQHRIYRNTTVPQASSHNR